ADERLVGVLLQPEHPQRLVDDLHRTAQLPAGRSEDENVVHDGLGLSNVRARECTHVLDSATRITPKMDYHGDRDRAGLTPTRSLCPSASAVGQPGASASQPGPPSIYQRRSNAARTAFPWQLLR